MPEQYYDIYQKNPPFSDLFFSQFLRTLGKCYSQCADVGECYITLHSIKDGDRESWYENWHTLARQIERLGEKSWQSSNPISAAKSWLRAAEYYRASEFFLRDMPDDPRILPCYDRLQFCFERALNILHPEANKVRIPFSPHPLEGYYIPSAGVPRATFILPGGYDSTVEENYSFAQAACQHGYDTLIFDAPGQGHMLRRYHCYMRPDFEDVLTATINWLEKNARSSQYIGLGRSFGGYLMPRAACHEHRLSALICDPPQMNLAASLDTLLPPKVKTLLQDRQKDALDTMFAQHFQSDPLQGFYFKSRMAAHGLDSVFDYFQCLKDYSFETDIGQIECPVLVCGNTHDPLAKHSPAFFKALSCAKKEYIEFSARLGAGSHCEMDAGGQFESAVFDWMERVLI